jgi:phage-related protein
MNWEIIYYSAKVRDQVLELPDSVLADYLRLLDLLREHGADLRLPHSRAMGKGLFELRPKGHEGIGRVFYCTQVERRIVILHSFVKKTQQTPPTELEIARKRLREVKNGQ